jgi:aryl-alcohol dehydrogenase-like predicted oxidoreductase
VDDRESLATLNRALDLGVNLFDTADVYGSEPLLGQLRRQRREPFYIATKMGMQVNPDARGYTRKNMTTFVENSLRSLGVEVLDLMQLHCPPIAVYNAEVFGILDDLVKQGKLRYYSATFAHRCIICGERGPLCLTHARVHVTSRPRGRIAIRPYNGVVAT